MCLSYGLSCMGLCTFWTWVAISFPMLGKFSTIISSNIFSDPFFFSSSSSYNSNVVAYSAVPDVPETVLNSFHSFFLFCSLTVISTFLSSSSLIHSSASVILLLIPSSVFVILVFVLFISVVCSLVLLDLC